MSRKSNGYINNGNLFFIFLISGVINLVIPKGEENTRLPRSAEVLYRMAQEQRKDKKEGGIGK